jgi:hypothetical protein
VSPNSMKGRGEHRVHVLPPTLLTLTNLAPNGVLTIPFAQRVPSHGAREAVLVGRLHAGTNIPSAAQSIACAIQFDAWTPNDPATQFQAALTTPASFTFSGAISVSTMRYVGTSISQRSAGASFGDLVAITVTATQTITSDTFLAVLSLEVIFKGGAGARRVAPGHFIGYR